MPVWFVLEGDGLYLLPVQGSDTQWYKNVLKKPSIRIEVGGAAAELKVACPRQIPRQYGASDVRKYYSKLDVAVVAQMR
jgi:hypothetical protein